MHAASPPRSARLGMVAQLHAADRTIKLLLLNDLGFNLGFYMLMPYIAGHLSSLAVPAWAIGLILGTRNLSQQGLFIIGGSLADRGDYKTIIMAGCVLRVVGFALFGLAESVPGLIAASVLTGMAAALFTPALKAYLSVAARDQRPQAFALSAVLTHAGALLGPLIGLLVLTIGFRPLAFAAALVFLLWAGLVKWYLPPQRGTESSSGGVGLHGMWQDWQHVLGDRRFVTFSLAMAGYAVLFAQLYLALPLALDRATGSQAPVGISFLVSGLMALALQVRITAFGQARWQPATAIAIGLAIMGAAFLPLAVLTAVGADQSEWAAAVIIALTAILNIGMMLAFPFTMNMISVLAGERRLGVYYGVYYLIAGVAATLGNILIGATLEASVQSSLPVVWLALAAIGLGSAAAVTALERRGVLPATASVTGVSP